MSAISERAQQRLIEADVFWLYPGSPDSRIPHALLTSGQHSDGFANLGQALKERPEVRREFARDILAVLLDAYKGGFDGVVGADTSSTLLAQDVAEIAGVAHIRMVKVEDDQGKRQDWWEGNAPLADGQTILHIEELITTSGSALQVRDGIRRANPDVKVRFAPFLPVVVERSDPDDRVVWVEESKILPLLQLSIRNYKPNPEECPYCAVGSLAIRPKEGDNWLRLTGKIRTS